MEDVMERRHPRRIGGIGGRGGRATGIVAFALVAMWAAGLAGARDLDVVFFPTPQPVVEKMLEMAAVKPDDFLIDLGSGDGRIPITAAKKYGARALGVDLDEALISQSRATAERENLAARVEFRKQDLFETDLTGATVVTLFLSHSINMKLRPRLQKLAPGTRIVAYGFAMGDWEPDRTETINGRYVYLWTVREAKPPAGP
jgi:SAM-dependent methyltransferase